METLSLIVQLLGSLITMIILPILLFKSQKKKADAEAQKEAADNITTYAEQWKELYEKKEHRVHELDAKIDSLYDEITALRNTAAERETKLSELILKNQALEFRKCNRHGCAERQPPSEY